MEGESANLCLPVALSNNAGILLLLYYHQELEPYMEWYAIATIDHIFLMCFIGDDWANSSLDQSGSQEAVQTIHSEDLVLYEDSR